MEICLNNIDKEARNIITAIIKAELFEAYGTLPDDLGEIEKVISPEVVTKIDKELHKYYDNALPNLSFIILPNNVAKIWFSIP